MMRAFLVYSINDDYELKTYGCKVDEQDAKLLREQEESKCEITEIFIKGIEIDHKCSLPISIQEALNSGDGIYRP